MTVGEKVKMLREEKGWSQEELAKKCGYGNRSAICKIETSGDNVTSKKVEILAKALDVSPSFLMGWDDRITFKTSDDGQVMPDDPMIYRLLRYYEKLNEHGKYKLMDYLEDLHDSDKYRK